MTPCPATRSLAPRPTPSHRPRRATRLVAVALAPALLAAACGGGDDSQADGDGDLAFVTEGTTTTMGDDLQATTSTSMGDRRRPGRRSPASATSARPVTGTHRRSADHRRQRAPAGRGQLTPARR